MSYRLIAHATSLSTLAATLLFSFTLAHAQQASGGCDQACLRQMLDTYLAAVFKHDPGAVPLTADHFATENTAVIRNGEGFWKDVSGYGEVQRRYFDPANQSAAYLGLLKQKGQDEIASVRIKVDGGKVSEAEWIIGTEGSAGRGMSSIPGMLKYPPPEGPLPASDRSSRFMLISVANDYFQAVKDHDGSWIPKEPECTQPAGEKNAISSLPRRADICHDNFGIFGHITKDLALRRFPLIDEEAGVILGAAIFTRYPGVNRPDNMVHEYFQIRNGKITGMWTSQYLLPMGSPVTSGWENQQGGITR